MRIQVNVSEAMLSKIDKYVEYMGVTRSSFCSQLIAQGLIGMDKAFEAVEELKNETVKELKNKTLEELENL